MALVCAFLCSSMLLLQVVKHTADSPHTHLTTYCFTRPVARYPRLEAEAMAACCAARKTFHIAEPDVVILDDWTMSYTLAAAMRDLPMPRSSLIIGPGVVWPEKGTLDAGMLRLLLRDLPKEQARLMERAFWQALGARPSRLHPWWSLLFLVLRKVLLWW